MDMMSYFLGRLAGGDGGVPTSYKSIEYQEGDKIIFVDEEGDSHTMECTYENGKIKSISFNGETLELDYDGDVLKTIGETETNMILAPTFIAGPGGEQTIVVDASNSTIGDDGILDFGGMVE